MIRTKGVRRPSRTENTPAASRKHLAYVPALDGLRAVAVSLVIFSHVGAPFFTGGGMGVDMFFVLSGFLITTLLLDEIDLAGGIDIPHFYMRRLLRLYPPLLLLLLFFAILCDVMRHSLPNMEQLEYAKDIFFAATYLTDYAVVFGYETQGTLIGHTWSLAVEEQFYLVWPWVLIWLTRRCSGRKIVAALAGLYLAGTAWRLICLSFQPWYLVYFRFDTRLAGLVLGALLAAMRTRGVKLPWAMQGLLLSGAVFVYCIGTLPSMEVLTYEITIAEVFTFFLIYLVMETRKFALRDWLSRPVPVFLGRISYALYLFHFPVATLCLRTQLSWDTALKVTLAIAVSLAWFSWNTVEKLGRAKAQSLRRLAARRHTLY